ncbi:MAG: PAS domain-containing protein, partial [Firmicutes bacterium]|nr:PAS domain-containing protein [Bacillota bacterium]
MGQNQIKKQTEFAFYSDRATNKLSVEELTKQNNRLAIINQIAKSINIKMTYEEIIDRFAVPLQEVISYNLLSFCLLENQNLVIKSGIPKEQKILGVGTVLCKYNSAPWRAIKEKQCFLRQDIWNDVHKYEEDDCLKQTGIKSAVMAPMLVNNEVIGTLNLGSKEAFAFSANDFIFVQQLADQLAICLENNRLYHEVVEVKREWEETFKAVPDLLFVIDKSYKIVRINHGYQGKPLDKIVGKKCYEVFDFCNREYDKCPAQRAIKTRRESSREITKQEFQRIISINAYPLFSQDGEFSGVVVYSKDVTAKRSMESQLFQSAKLAAIGEMAAGVAHELNSPL